MRVLVVLPGVSPDGGAERSFVAMVPGLQRAGIRLHVAVFTERQGLVGDLERLGVVIHDLSATRALLARVSKLTGVIRATGADLVHASLHEANVPAQIAARLCGKPVLVTWANTDYGEARHREPGSPLLKLAAVRALDTALGHLARTRYHAVTPAVGELNAAALGVPEHRVMVGRRGRDPAAFEFHPPSDGPSPIGAQSRSAEVSSRAGRVVLAVGRQDNQKGYPALLGQFDRLAAVDPDVRLRIVGREGSATSAIRHTLSGLRHRGRVELTGHRNDVAALLADADVFVCSSWREGAAGAVIEAMASGTPVVSVPLAGAADMLVDGHNAVVVPHEQLAQGLQRVLEDRELASRLAKTARATFEECFTVERAAARMAEIYRLACGGDAQRSDGG